MFKDGTVGMSDAFMNSYEPDVRLFMTYIYC